MSSLKATQEGQPANAEKPVLSTPANKRTPNQVRKFLDAYAESGTVTAAAKAAGISRMTHFRRLKSDPQYQQECNAVENDIGQQIEDACVKRARDGTKRLQLWRGKRLLRDQAAQPAFALHERQLAEILAIQPQDVEGVEVWFAPAVKQLAENRAAVRPYAHELAIQDRVFHLQALGDGRAQRLEGFVGVLLAADQTALTSIHVRQRAEPVQLNSDSHSGWSKASLARARTIGRISGSPITVFLQKYWRAGAIGWRLIALLPCGR
jgi:hypothetical protein